MALKMKGNQKIKLGGKCRICGQYPLWNPFNKKNSISWIEEKRVCLACHSIAKDNWGKLKNGCTFDEYLDGAEIAGKLE